MGAISNVTNLSNTWQVNKVLSARAAPEFAKSTVAMNLIYAEDLPSMQGTAVKGFRRTGALAIPSSLAESNSIALGTPRSDTVVDATAAKMVRADGVSFENQKFGMAEVNGYVQSQAKAIARGVDNQVLALFPSVTNLVDCAGALTIDRLDDAQLLILQAEVPNPDQQLVFLGSARSYRNLKSDIRTSSGAAFQSEKFLSIFDGPPKSNYFYGSLPGIDLFYAPSGFTAVSSQSSQCLFHPQWAFAGMFDNQINVLTTQVGAGGLYTEVVSYFFWASVLWNDTAAVEVLSTT
jgi:hypothetical protein